MKPRRRVLARQIGIQIDSGDERVINMDLEAPSTRIRIFLKAEPFFPFPAIPPPPPPFFFRLVSNAFPDIGLIGRIEKKKKLEKKNQ